MNFLHMPELVPPWAYPLAAALTVVLTGTLLFWLRKRRWI